MSPREVLVAARKVIEKPENWTQEADARTLYNQVVSLNDANAYKFCSVGAIERAAGNFACAYDSPSAVAVEALERYMGPVGRFNDTHTHAEVLAAFDKAIAEAA